MGREHGFRSCVSAELAWRALQKAQPAHRRLVVGRAACTQGPQARTDGGHVVPLVDAHLCVGGPPIRPAEVTFSVHTNHFQRLLKCAKPSLRWPGLAWRDVKHVTLFPTQTNDPA